MSYEDHNFKPPDKLKERLEEARIAQLTQHLTPCLPFGLFDLIGRSRLNGE